MTKPAYLVFGVDIDDADIFRKYAQGAGPLLTKFGGTVLSATNSIEILDGNWSRGRATVLKFPSLELAHALWEAPEYAPLKALRESCSHSDVILVEGMMDEDPDAAHADEGTPHYMLGGNDTRDSSWIPEYQAKVPPISAKYGLKALIASDRLEILDGNWPRQQMILLKFPSEESYLGFWSDPDYLPLKKLREDNTEGDHITFPGGFEPV